MLMEFYGIFHDLSYPGLTFVDDIFFFEWGLFSRWEVR